LVICDRWDVVVVPFPFTDRGTAKRRPALVLSTRSFNAKGHSVLAMITSVGHAPWPGDTILRNYTAAGLHVPCLVRLKLFTLDNRLFQKKLGRPEAADRKRTAANLARFLT
jgi:mRNA interferase MazF